MSTLLSGAVMVALYPPATTAQALAQPEGEPAAELHLTLAYLGDAAVLADAGRLATLVEAFAATCPPLVATVSGTGRFTNGPAPVTWASVDCPCLSEMREELCEALDRAGIEMPAEHGFQPHITLAYDDRPLSLPPVDLIFDSVTLVIGGERRSWPLTGEPHEHGTPVDVYQMERTVPVWKDEAAQVVYGVVLQPGVTDSQGDNVSAAEIEQAAHRYFVESRKLDVQHGEEQAAVEPVESYIAPMDMVVAGRKVLKGAWVMGVHVIDPDLWARVVSGEITGFSIGGTAVRDDVAA